MGEKVTSSFQNSKNIGVLYDDLGLFERLSVYDNISIYCKIYNLPTKSIDEALKIVGLENEKQKKVWLSKDNTYYQKNNEVIELKIKEDKERLIEIISQDDYLSIETCEQI